MPEESVSAEEIRRIAQERLGYEDLRPGQEDAIRCLLEGRDTLAIMPTGSGKSAIYRIAGHFIPGLTVVISPLIALQRDQTESIEGQDVGDAVQVNSTLGTAERREAMEHLDKGDLEFLFLAPEQFANPETLEHLQSAKPSLFVIDEAHCISEWGHDFRPHYLRLGSVIEALGHPTVLAMTATAAAPVREEIRERLGMTDPCVLVHGFDRPNIWLGVGAFTDEGAKRDTLLERVQAAEKPGIVYCATRRHAEEIAGTLAEAGVKAVAYHAGLKKTEREDAQEAFMADGAEVIVATKAFGMGIDKPNVRFVYHYDVSDSIDSYYQEIGRAGRDGEPAEALLFYYPKDLNLHRFLSASGKVEPEAVERVVEAMQESDEPVDLEALGEAAGLSRGKLAATINRLEEIGAAEVLVDGEVAPTERPGPPEEIAEAASELQEQHRQFQRSRLEMIRQYAELRTCYREYLLNYFGEAYEPPCGSCGNCLSGATERAMEKVQALAEDLPFPLNSRVRHEDWGEGMVLRYEGNKLVALFDEVGYKTLSLEIVKERGLLEPIRESKK